MLFLIDDKNKIIFGWSTKCGCSHVKKIFWFLQNNNIDNVIHTYNDIKNLPNSIEEYKTILFIRNPYKRIVSGFLDKYRKNGEFRHLWKYSKITFSTFVEELLKKTWRMVDKPHFIPQTDGMFDKNKIMKSNSLKIFDIENIDYNYIENMYNKKLPNELLDFKWGHERVKFDEKYDKDVYDLEMDVYYNYNVPVKNFYDNIIKSKVFQFYSNDFLFFKENGFDYENSLL